MTLEILVSSALMGYTMDEQTRILSQSKKDLTSTARPKKGAEKVMEVFNDWDPVVEGYAGFPVEREQSRRRRISTKMTVTSVVSFPRRISVCDTGENRWSLHRRR